MTTQSLGRGPFKERVPAYLKINREPNARHIRFMQHINLHGPLSSFLLYEHCGPKSYEGFKDAIKALWRMGYVYRPVAQTETINANYNPYVYDLTDKGKLWLQENGYWIEAHRPSGNFIHQLMTASVTATIHTMCEREGYRFIPAHEYLGDRPMKVDTSFEWEGRMKTMPLVPDSLFAIDYGNSFVAYALEADRNTEPITSNKPDRKSDERTIKQYDTFIGTEQYKKDYGRNAPMVLLFVTVNATRAQSFLNLYDKPCRYAAAGVVKDFAKPFKPTGLLTHLFNGPLARAGKEPWYIKKNPAQ